MPLLFKVFSLLLLIASFLPQAKAADIACDSLGGSVVFRDSLYGLGLGAIIGGLGVAASENADNAGQIVAGTALAGTLLGLGFGVYEVTARDCSEPKPDQYNKNEYNFKSSELKAGLQVPKFVFIPQHRASEQATWAMQLGYRF